MRDSLSSDLRLNLSCKNLVEGDFPDECAKLHIQRRATELTHEQTWRSIFDELEHPDQLRLLEGTTTLARAWLQVVPGDPQLKLSNRQMRYALRRTLLLPSLHANPDNGLCPKCAAPLTPMHHLCCHYTSGIRTTRHSALRKAIASAFRKVLPSKEEQLEFGLRHDIISTHPEEGDRVYVDVGVCSLESSRWECQPWPTAEMVEEEVERELAEGTTEPLFFWEDHSEETPHPDVVKARVFRRMAVGASVGACMGAMSARKTIDFYRAAPAGSAFVPLVLTAGGGISAEARDLVHSFTRKVSDKDGVRAEYRRLHFGRWSILLVKHAASMAWSLGAHSAY